MINDYGELVTEAAVRSGVSDVPSRAPMLVGMAENWLSKQLRMADQQTATTLTTDANGDAALPSDYESMQVVYYGTRKVERRPLEDVLLKDTAGYAIQGTTFKSSLTSTAHSIVYYASIPSLASNGTNWLLTAEPDLYLQAVLFQIYVSKNDAANAQVTSSFISSMLDDVKSRDWANRRADTKMKLGGSVV